jgi:predicted secreted protein
MWSDVRGKRIALVSHCVLNQNAVVGGLARSPGALSMVAEMLAAHGFGIVQMPCPEMHAVGIDRWGAVREQYETAACRRSFNQVVEFVLDDIEDFITHGYGVVLIGIQGSPSCGITRTVSCPDWGGSPPDARRDEVAELPEPGAFMRLLADEVAHRGWAPLPSFDLPDDIGTSPQSTVLLDEFLNRYPEDLSG